MARVIAGMGTPHAPSVGAAIDRHEQNSPYWKPLFDGFGPMRAWLAREKPDVLVLFSNDHFTSFFLDVIPAFAIGVAGMHEIADEGWGKRALPPVPGHTELAWHLARSVTEDGFDPAVCHRLPLDHGCLTPLSALTSWTPDWPVKVIPILVNVLHFPIPSPARCFALGHAVRRAIASFEDDLKVVVLGTGGLSHQLVGERFGFVSPEWDSEFLDRLRDDPDSLARLQHRDYIERGGSESVEVILWLCMRGCLSAHVRQVHRNYYHATLTGYGQVIYEDMENLRR
ncbi:MAG TPA: class III extradiol dioxygenase family protein [Steroidobacteraceae bacterium]|nr:class III extradiol dioxygenase family protein [Steroidobacteraceae bacterium]